MKIIKITYLISSNILIIYLIYKFVFSDKIPTPYIGFFLSFLCLNFAIITMDNIQDINVNKILFIIFEWILGFTVIYFLNELISGQDEITYWIIIFLASIIGGFLTIVNFSKTLGIKINLKTYLIKLIILSLVFPLVEFIYFFIFYQKKFYDLSFYVFIPQIIVVILWQIFNFLELNKRIQSTKD